MERSSNIDEPGSTKGGHPVFAALYDPLGRSMERAWMGGRRKRVGFDTFESFYPPVPLSGLTPHVQGSATVRRA
jgi:hypothetical protein